MPDDVKEDICVGQLEGENWLSNIDFPEAEATKKWAQHVQADDEAILIVFSLWVLIREDAQVVKDGDVIAFRDQRLPHILVDVEVCLQGSQQVLYFKAVFALEVEGGGEGGDHFGVSW